MHAVFGALAAAILVYKTIGGPKKTKKLVHLSLQAVAFLFSLVGVWAAYDFHIKNSIDNFYSFHSWLGIVTVILFLIQVRRARPGPDRALLTKMLLCSSEISDSPVLRSKNSSVCWMQWVVGFFSFWTQSVGQSTRTAVLPWHVFLGLLIFVLAICTAATGIFEKITFLQKDGAVGHYESEAIFVNITAMVVVLFGAVTIFAAIIPTSKEEDGYQPIS